MQSLLVQNLRIIEHLDIPLAGNANLFVGDNGMGKTSILEAIDMLSRGRSFRERRTSPLLRKNSSTMTISGALAFKKELIHLGIQKSSNQTVLHCNQEKVASITNHASYLPVVSMHPDSHQLIQGSGKYRRNYLDWSAFHVKPNFLKYWREYNKCLRQRNRALQDKSSLRELAMWTKELSEKATLVDAERLAIFEEINPIFMNYNNILLPECEVSATYHRGWPEGIDLETALLKTSTQEAKRKTTQLGPHRAELRLSLNQQAAAATASRGQQKQLVACLLLSQIEHFQQSNGHKCTVLLDDICAELDQDHSAALLHAIQKLGSQVFITAIEPKQVNLQGWNDTNVFHVKQGRCELSS